MSPSANDASRGSAIRLGAEMAGRVVSLGTSVVLAGRLGVADFGTFAALSGAAALLAELANGGLLTMASRELVTGGFSLRSLGRAKLVLSLSITLLAGAIHGAWPALSVLVLYFVWAGWSELFGVALRSAGRPLGEASVLLVLKASGLAFVAIALPAGPRAGPASGLEPAAQALFLSTLPPLALAGVLLRGRAQPRPGPAQGAVPVSRVLKASLPLAVNGVLAMASLRLELLVLLLIRGPRETGLFAAALRVVEPLLSVPASISAGAMPALTREAESGGGSVRARTAATVAFLAVPAAAGLALVGPRLLPLVGGDFEAAAGPLRLLAGALAALFMNTVLLHALVAAGRSTGLPRLTGLRLLIAAALALVLIPAGGARGAAAGFLGAELGLLLLASSACARAGFGIAWAAPLALAGGFTLPMIAALAVIPAGPGAAILLGVAVYATTLWAAWRGSLLSRVFRA